MAYADPQSLNVGTSGAAVSLPRVGQGQNSGAFASNDGARKLSISHSYGKRTRRQLRIDDAKVATDPLNAAQNLRYSASVYLVVDSPAGGVGYSVSDLQLMVTALATYLTASTGAATVKLLGGES